ncbi:NUDIX hydrolase [Frigoribacterium sp. 2-23]|uniref:NUDIX hydrolase n=1 Tax=Frigoribacterium sp. 2-23 TaxID=3415006 RepID=UPI003C703A25
MATPDFVLALRDRVGTAPLWLSGVTAVVLRDDETLLVRRADNGEWTPVTGIIDPGEEPADAAVRECAEEADVVVEPLRLALVGVTHEVVYANGDQAQYLDHTFVMRWISGEPAPADGENTEARWFPLDGLPPMAEHMTARLEAARQPGTGAAFGFAGRMVRPV